MIAETTPAAELTARRRRWRTAYRAAYTVLQRMHDACQPLEVCQQQAKVVEALRNDIADTFAQGDLVTVQLQTTTESGVFMGRSSYQGLLIYTTIEGGLMVHADADRVFAADERKGDPNAVQRVP